MISGIYLIVSILRLIILAKFLSYSSQNLVELPSQSFNSNSLRLSQSKFHIAFLLQVFGLLVPHHFLVLLFIIAHFMKLLSVRGKPIGKVATRYMSIANQARNWILKSIASLNTVSYSHRSLILVRLQIKLNVKSWDFLFWSWALCRLFCGTLTSILVNLPQFFSAHLIKSIMSVLGFTIIHVVSDCNTHFSKFRIFGNLLFFRFFILLLNFL